MFELRVNRFGQLVCATTKGCVLVDAPHFEKLTNTLLSANGLPRQPVNNVMLLPDGIARRDLLAAGST